MTEDLTKTDSWNLLYRLREHWAVPAAITAELERRLFDGRRDKALREQAERRIAWLEQHVPPEILRPAVAQVHRPRFTGD